MGKGRDKRKKAKGPGATAGQGAAKTEKKTQQNEDKKSRREAANGDEDDIDAILASLDKAKAAKSGVQVTDDAPPPGPRICCVWLPTGDQKADDIVLFGGELWDQKADKMYVYDDLYRYSPAKGKWTHVRSRGPHPRSACAAAVHRGCLYVFGGEFTSPNQEKFRHFRDLWRLDLATYEWDELRVKGGPSARSGHRMACHKGTLYLFGGFHDTGAAEPKYFRDLWAFDTEALAWESLGNMRDKWPRARSAFQWVVHGDRLVMHGGYAKRVDEDEADMEHGRALDDTWAWHIDTKKWERLPKQGMAPSLRSSFALVPHKNSAVLFGGAADEEAKKGEVIVSNFFNDLYQLNLAQARWYPVAMRLGGSARAKEEMADITARMGAVTTDADAARAAAATRIQAHYRGHVVRRAYKLYRIGGTVSEVLYSPAAYGVDLSSRDAPKPRARINASACVVKSTLWLFGGCVEVGDKEVTLDDLWRLDLAKLDGWHMVKDNTAGKADFEAGDAASSGESSEWESDGEGDAALPKVSAVSKKRGQAP